MTSEPYPDTRNVVLAVATYRRPSLLRELLPVLVRQACRLDRPCQVVVVDNDPAESARSVVDEFSDEVVYALEPRPGIAAARNRALDVAADLLAAAVVFIDDDETPTDSWLQTLVNAWSAWEVAAVVGPVVSHFEGEVERWVVAAPTFRRPRRKSGDKLPSAATNNLILSTDVLLRHGLRFDDDFGLSGGSDTMLTRTLVSLGEEIRWCDEAEVREQVPAERATRAWIMRRHRRSGNVGVRVRLALAPPGGRRVQARFAEAGRAGVRLLKGGIRIVAGTVSGNLALRVRGWVDVATGRGELEGAVGRSVIEYLRAD